MTTVYKQKLLLLSFQGRSPQQIYIDACTENGVRVQKSLLDLLSNVPDDFSKLQQLLCPEILFGTRGCMALVPIIQCSRSLRRLNLRGCGITDAFVAQLVEAIQEHPNVRNVDLSYNPNITVNSAKAVVKLCELNTNLMSFHLEETHIGRNVAKAVTTRCEANRHRLVSYFADDYFRMKDLFAMVDADASGWVHIKTIIGSVGAPILQERLVERIAMKRPKKRQDNCIHINTFLELVYLNYKTLSEIAERAANASGEDDDQPAETIKSNWALLLASFRKHNVTCSALTKCRFRKFLMSPSEADELVAAAVDLQNESDKKQGVNDDVAVESPPPSADQQQHPSSAPPGTAPPARDLDARHLLNAAKVLFPTLPQPAKSYGFLVERAEDYISPILLRIGNGSRAMSITDLNGSNAPSVYSPSICGDNDDEDPPHTWTLPPAMARAIVQLFAQKKAAASGQASHSSQFNVSPPAGASLTTTPMAGSSTAIMGPSRGREDLLIDDFLDSAPETELEYLKINTLYSKYVEIGVPTDMSHITLQEAVNLLDELYDVVRVDKVFTVAQIAEMVQGM